MRRIGIMGGTFNPIHNGHLAIAGKAEEQFRLEKVLFMPSGVPYMKNLREVLPVRIRCEMTALAIRENPCFVLSEMEASDAGTGENTYTYETLLKLRLADPEASYYFILGADSLYAMEDWKNPALIFENCTVLAAVRTQEMPQSENPMPSGRGNGDCMAAEPSGQDRFGKQVRYLREKYGASIEILEFAGMEISSTQIRERVRDGESIHGMVPDLVEKYITHNGLYHP